METRKPQTSEASKFSPLPSDFTKMVAQVFTTNFDAGLKALKKVTKGKYIFQVTGRVYATEVLLAISLVDEGQLAATTVHTSCDYDPKASSPTVQDLLAACVDAAGALFGQLLSTEDEDRLEQLASESLASLENVPFEWTSLKVEKHTVFLRLDKSNPQIDQMADSWLEKNDPHFREREEEERQETEKLFVTGKKKPGTDDSGSGGVH